MTLIKSISGIRGTIGGNHGDNLTPIDAVNFGCAYGQWLINKNPNSKHKVIIGRDARISGEMIQNLVQFSLISMGIDIVDLGLSTTPTVELMVQKYNAHGGIIITASHNPIQWNALKLLNENGEFLNSHEGKLYSHHNSENFFVGKIDTKKNKIGIKNSVSITGTAGTVVFFHCRSVHGSGHNQMNSSRPLILFGYRASDAWPLINDGNPHPEVDLDNYDKNIIVGNKSIKPRLTKVPTIIPLPKKKHYVSIYELQKN